MSNTEYQCPTCGFNDLYLSHTSGLCLGCGFISNECVWHEGFDVRYVSDYLKEKYDKLKRDERENMRHTLIETMQGIAKEADELQVAYHGGPTRDELVELRRRAYVDHHVDRAICEGVGGGNFSITPAPDDIDDAYEELTNSMALEYERKLHGVVSTSYQAALDDLSKRTFKPPYTVTIDTFVGDRLIATTDVEYDGELPPHTI